MTPIPRRNTPLDTAASVMAPPARPRKRATQRWWNQARRSMAAWKTRVENLMRSLDRAPPRRPASPRLSPRKTEAPILVCRLNLRLTRWMLRTSARGWWQELFPSRAASPERNATPPAGPWR
jgi:hypothetical protein